MAAILSSTHFPPEFEGNFLNANVISFQGIYRVGVDYPSSCDGRRDDEPYAVAVDVRGERRIHRGLARFLVFDLIATEFEVGAPGDPDAPGDR